MSTKTKIREKPMEDLIPLTLLCVLAVGVCYLVSIYQNPSIPAHRQIAGQAILVAANGAACQIEYGATIINQPGQLPIVVLERLSRCPAG